MAVQELTHTFVQEILGKRDSELLGLIPGAKEMADLKQEALRSGVPQTKELMVGDGNETQKCLVLICEPTVNAAGATTGLTTLCMDVTYQAGQCTARQMVLTWDNSILPCFP